MDYITSMTRQTALRQAAWGQSAFGQSAFLQGVLYQDAGSQELRSQELLGRLAQLCLLAALSIASAAARISAVVQVIGAQVIGAFVLPIGGSGYLAGDQYGAQLVGLADLPKRIRSGKCRRIVSFST